MDEDSDMIDFKEENTKETQRSFRPIQSIKVNVNMVYIMEFPKDDEELARIGTPLLLIEEPPLKDNVLDSSRLLVGEAPRTWPSVIMIETPPFIGCLDFFQEGIAEEASDNEEEQRAQRARRESLLWKRT